MSKHRASTSTGCQHCGRAVSGVTLCAVCTQTLRVCLTSLPAYFADVSRLKPPARVHGKGTADPTGNAATSAARDRVSEALDNAESTVTRWAKLFAAARPAILLPAAATDTTERAEAAEVRRLCGWLEQHLNAIITLTWAGELLHGRRHPDGRWDISSLTHYEHVLQRIIDNADTGWSLGECGAEVGHDPDGEPVRCVRPLYAVPTLRYVRCPECGATWDVPERREWTIAQARDHVGTVREIARAVVGLIDTESSVERLAARIDQWVTRGRLHRQSFTAKTYRVGDVMDLIREDHATRTEKAS